MSDAHQTLDSHRARLELDALLEHVTRNWGRIEITRADGGGDSCVLLSKAELQTIERALEILCELPGGRQICDEITAVAERCMASIRSNGAPPGALLHGDGSSASAPI
jgi:hypothetical protein